MKKLVLAHSLLVCALHSVAQFTVQKYFNAGGAAHMNIEQLSSGNLLTGINNCSGVTVMNSIGNIVHSHCIDVLPYTNVQSVRKHTDNEFYFVGGVIADSCSVDEAFNVNPVVGKMDSLGNIQSLYNYDLNALTCYNPAIDLTITNDAGAVTWGREESFFALRVDHDGLALWSKQFAHDGSFAFFREFPGGDLLAGFNMDTAGVGLARLNAAGDILWCKSYIRPKGNVQDCVIETDSSFVVTGYTDSIGSHNVLIPLPPDYQPKLFMMRLNGTGEVQWCKGFAGGSPWYTRSGLCMVRTQDDKYVMLANIGAQNYNFAARPYLLKTDQNGDTLWSRSVGISGYLYSTVHLTAGSDGGFYYDGIADGDFGQWGGAAYLFKTDSLGHLPCHERTFPVEVMDLFPVDSSFTLSAVEGALANVGSVSDVPYDPIAVLDGCTLSPTGVHSYDRPAHKMSVRPNPNTGTFTMAFKDPLMADSWYSVYDATGKLLYQRPLPAGKGTEEVDLSRYGKGTYVIKCTDKEGVYHERVVVE